MKEENKEEIDVETIKELLELIQGKTKEESLAKAIEHLASEDKIMLFSDVDYWEIPKLATLKVIALRYDLDWLDQFLSASLLLRVSKNRLGRKEIVNLASSKSVSLSERFRSFFKPKEEEKITLP
mgnify:CR=1 FL=1